MRLLRAFWLQVLRPYYWAFVWDFMVPVPAGKRPGPGLTIVQGRRVYQLARVEGGWAFWQRIL